MSLETVFLDAGGVLVYPNWARVADELARHGVQADAAALAAAEPAAKRKLDVGKTIDATNDASRGWLYFNLVLEAAGVPRSAATDAALADLHAFHMTNNLWEHVPHAVPAVLGALRDAGLRLVVVSNANGTLRRAFGRLGLDQYFVEVLDSCEVGIEKPIRASSSWRWRGRADRRHAPSTSATSITSMSSGRARPAFAVCCSTREACMMGSTVHGSHRSTSCSGGSREGTSIEPTADRGPRTADSGPEPEWL